MQPFQNNPLLKEIYSEGWKKLNLNPKHCNLLAARPHHPSEELWGALRRALRLSLVVLTSCGVHVWWPRQERHRRVAPWPSHVDLGCAHLFWNPRASQEGCWAPKQLCVGAVERAANPELCVPQISAGLWAEVWLQDQGWKCAHLHVSWVRAGFCTATCLTLCCVICGLVSVFLTTFEKLPSFLLTSAVKVWGRCSDNALQ